MDDKCDRCGANMVPLFTGMACSAECDVKYPVISDILPVFSGDLKSAFYVGNTLSGMEFKDCDLRGANFAASTLTNVLFTRCDLQNTTWSAATIDDVTFRECEFDGADWDSTIFFNVIFVNCTDAPLV
jgi:Pentapeptide repeats (9 copies)